MPEDNELCPLCRKNTWKKWFSANGFDFVRCGSCRLHVRLDPLPTKEVLADYYANHDTEGGYHPTIAGERRRNHQALFSAIKKVVGKADRRKYLDLGCYDGQLVDFAKEEGWDAYGAEYMLPAVEEARRKHGEDRIFHADLDVFDYGRLGTYDVISAIDLVEHMVNPFKLFELASHCLSPDGWFVLQTPRLDSLTAKILGRYWVCFIAPVHVHYFSLQGLKTVAGRYGMHMMTHTIRYKNLRVGYALDQVGTYWPSWSRSSKAIARVLPNFLTNARIYFTVGEVMVYFKKIN